ncbi:ATP-binding protein [Streptomyces sp. NPDC050095]|uniref:ATP-binding protein n=1 Tax=unclassified Streptomyces TaxID=2593676 RepID=UPI00342993A7
MIPIATRPVAGGAPSPTELPRVVPAVREARAFVNQRLDEWGLADMTDEAALVMSELATNAVRHGSGRRIEIDVTRGPSGRVRLSVSDASKAIPILCNPSVDSGGGRGLQLVDHLSHSWGTDLFHDKKTVWAELVPHPRDEADPERSHPH